MPYGMGPSHMMNMGYAGIPNYYQANTMAASLLAQSKSNNVGNKSKFFLFFLFSFVFVLLGWL